MSEYIFKLPDLGEGTVESEIAEWNVSVGDTVAEEDILGTMMTDKAAVELNSSEMTCEIGDFGECWCREHRSVSWAPFYVCATPREVLQGPKLGDIRYPEGDPTE